MKKDNDYSTDVKKQHTVPRFLLDYFGHGKNKKKRRVFTYDKLNGRTYQQSVYDATTRNTFYNIEGDLKKASLEPILSNIEAEAATAIKKIINDKSLANLTIMEKEKISTFVVVQQARTYQSLQSLESIMDSLADKVRAMGANPKDVKQLPNDQNDLKNAFLKTILDSVEHVPLILNKSWLLYETTKEMPFYISDNPVTLHNNIDMGIYGNIGLSVKGIQIYLPLSSTLTLAFTCNSIQNDAIQVRENFKIMDRSFLAANFTMKQVKDSFNLARAYESRNSLMIDNENVKFLNSLQVSFSEQYIFNYTNEFSLVKDMILDNPSFKYGRRMTIN